MQFEGRIKRILDSNVVLITSVFVAGAAVGAVIALTATGWAGERVDRVMGVAIDAVIVPATTMSGVTHKITCMTSGECVLSKQDLVTGGSSASVRARVVNAERKNGSLMNFCLKEHKDGEQPFSLCFTGAVAEGDAAYMLNKAGSEPGPFRTWLMPVFWRATNPHTGVK